MVIHEVLTCSHGLVIHDYNTDRDELGMMHTSGSKLDMDKDMDMAKENMAAVLWMLHYFLLHWMF